MSASETVTLIAAGFGAGFVNGVAGGGSLVSFPVLVGLGYPAVTANVTSTVGIWPGYLGGAAGYRRDLTSQLDVVRQLLPVTILGAGVGATLLLTTPASSFNSAAPWLILFACTVFAIQPVVAKRLSARLHDMSSSSSSSVRAGVFVASVYGAYFGAGLGVILLAVLGITLPDRLVRTNALRSVLALSVNTLAVIVFALRASVAWSAAGLLASASLIGGLAGSRLARRVPAPILRLCVVLFGVVAALRLLST